MRIFRRAVQFGSLGVFLYLLYLASFTKEPKVPYLFLRLDPLALLAGVAGRTAVPLLLSLSILVLAVLLGRVFCGWICPWGTLLDIFRKIFEWTRLARLLRAKPPLWLKYAILLVGVILSLFGVGFIFLLDPLSLSTRLWGWFLFMPLEKKVVVWGGLAIVPIILLEIFASRFWCRSLCPLGALLGLFSGFPLLRRKVSDACVDCGRCQRICPMSAIGEEPRETRFSECTLCWDCVKVCPTKAISFGKGGAKERVGLSRRSFLLSLFLGVVGGLVLKRGGKSSRLIRPPGAEEEKLLALCLRCGECIRACPTGGLRPALFEGGWEGVGVPRLVPRIGPCTRYCNICGEVCPTQAIKPFKIEDKPNLRIGLAEVDYERCLAYQGKECLVCYENCSYQAIDPVEGPRKPKIPRVNPEICVGCGSCEKHCPVKGEAAIRVFKLS